MNNTSPRNYEDLQQRYFDAWQLKGRWLGLYKELYWYVLPNRDAFNVRFNYQDYGKPTTNQIWDTTALIAAYQRANDLHGLLLPKDRIWGKFSLDPNKFPAALISQTGSIMDEINRNIFNYINQSNLARVVSSSLLDLVGGTAAMWVESIDDQTPLFFRSIPSVALYIEYNTDDIVGTCWYQCKKSGREILRVFKDYNGPMLKSLIESPNETYSVIYGQIKEDENKYYIYACLEEDQEHMLWDRESNYQQIIVFRDRVRPGEAEGRGIGLDMLPTIQTLNKVVEYNTKCLQFKAYPPMFYDSNAAFNPFSVRQWAGSMIERAPQARNPIEALQMPDSPDVLESIKDYRQQIENAFQVEPLGEMDTPVRSATEISIRENRAQRSSATDISRIINELPKQIYEVSTIILNNRNLLTRDRKPVDGFNVKTFKFDYVSPLFDLQDEQDLQNLVQSFQIKQQFWGPAAVLASVDIGKVNDFINDKLHLPRELSKSAQQIDQFIQSAAQAQQQAQLPQPSTAPITPGTQQPAQFTGVQV